jgi:hypothetical protein
MASSWNLTTTFGHVILSAAKDLIVEHGDHLPGDEILRCAQDDMANLARENSE